MVTVVRRSIGIGLPFGRTEEIVKPKIMIEIMHDHVVNIEFKIIKGFA